MDSDLNMWISQSNDEKKEDFLYGLTQRLVTGTDGFIKFQPVNSLLVYHLIMTLLQQVM
ncbi:hypothetical protein ICE98_03605 [Lactococcus lactis]|nr:hypothetical protein [Lactococcus lactis]